ncbi:Calcyphosin-like protein, partial [Globisporangium polare]
ALRGPLLSGSRLALVRKAFALMDSEGRGVVFIDDLRENYDVSFFPSVRAKKKSKQQALTEFLRQWEENADGGRISLDAFVGYYHNVSACITEDSDFELMMRQTWHVSSSQHHDFGSDDDEINTQSASSSTSSPGPAINTQATSTLSSAGVPSKEKTSHGDTRGEVSPTYSDPEFAMLGRDWRYLQTLLIPTAGVHSNSKIPTVDDVSRRLGANRIWGDGNEVLQRKVFVHALTLLDKQLSTKEALSLAQRVALAAAAMSNSTSTGLDGSIGLAALHRWLLSPCVPVAPSGAGNSNNSQPSNSSNVVDRVRNRLLQRISPQGNSGAADAIAASHVGLNGLQRCLKLIDTNGDKRLSKDELKLGLRKFGVDVNFHELDYLFTHFDADRSGCIAMDEFLVGMRGEVNARRLGFVHMAFELLDKDHDGSVTLEELASAYNTSKHPDVLSGRMTAEQALRAFAAQWESEKERDGVITKHEFEEYYKNLSASIDSDDYFELMMRNAWHISGGAGACANSTNRRVLVTKADQSQSVEEIKNDLGIKAGDYDKMRENLATQGVAVAHGGKQAIELYSGYVEPPKGRAVNRQAAPVVTAAPYNNSLEPPWQKKQSSKLQLQGKPNPKDQASQGRVFHRRRVLEMPESHRPDTAGSAKTSRGGSGVGVFAKSNTAATASNNALSQTQRREMERGNRQRAAQLIQNHFRGFKARKLVDCVRRKLAAERLREQQSLQAEQDSGRRKLVRPALKAYHGF